MIKKALIDRLFNAFTIQRWNDQIRPTPLVEMDKNGHKMVIAYCLARAAAEEGLPVNWHNVIRGGLFELLRRAVLSDIKSPIYRKIKASYSKEFQELSQWVYLQLEPEVSNPDVLQELHSYLVQNTLLDELSERILAASHVYASYWEFQIIREATPRSDTLQRIEHQILLDLAPYTSLTGLKRLLDRDRIAAFVDLMGQLRFQVRWGQTPRLPVTSVLGHSMMVAALAYLLTREIPGGACDARLRNNFFAGLLHDLPEALTRDIISPVKGAVKTLSSVIGEIERELVRKEVHPLLDAAWQEEFSYFTEDEFSSKIVDNGSVIKTTSDEISARFNADSHQPVDGELIKAADHLAAFVEAQRSIEAGFSTPELQEGYHGLRKLYTGKKIAGLNIGSIYADF